MWRSSGWRRQVASTDLLIHELTTALSNSTNEFVNPHVRQCPRQYKKIPGRKVPPGWRRRWRQPATKRLRGASRGATGSAHNRNSLASPRAYRARRPAPAVARLDHEALLERLVDALL